jgi:drug/metabolite transporter (DMT)-like permease
MFDFSKKQNQWITIVFLAIIWGSSFILMKKGLVSFTPTEITYYRIFLVFAILLPFSLKGTKSISLKKWGVLVLSGVIGSAIPYFLFIKAQTKIDSSLSGILNSLTPLFTLGFGFFIFKEKFKLKTVFGILIGLLGASGLIFFSSQGENFSSFSIYAALPIIGSACYALNLNLIKIYLGEINSLKITAWSFLFIGPIAGFLLFYNTDFISHLIDSKKGWESFIYINILGLLGTALAVWVFNLLIKHTSSLFASSVTYLIPIVAIIWGIVDGEIFDFKKIFFTLIILCSVYLTNNKN